MPRWPGRTLLLILLAVASATAADSSPVESAIARLGSAEFAEREAAQAELLGRGADPAAARALAAAARASDDAEIRQRAAGIVATLTRYAEGAALLKPRTVALNFRDVPLDAAVTELRKLTGANVRLDAGVADPARRVTATTGGVPAWEAVEAFRRAAGLVELFRDDAPPASAENAVPSVRRSYYNGPPVPATTANLVPVLWADAGAVAPTPLAADRSGPVRVTALPGRFAANRVVRGSGHVLIHLDVAPPADLHWESTQEVRVTRAEDETTRPITVAHPLPAPLPRDANEMMLIGGVFMNMSYSYGTAPFERGNPRLVPVTLKTDDRLVRRLRVLEGTIVGTVSIPNQTVLAVDDLANSSGVAFAGPGDTKLTVQNYAGTPGGKVTLKITVEGPNPWNQMRQGRRQAPVSLWDEGGLGHSGLKNYRFTDAAGQALTPQVSSTTASDNGTRQSSTMDVQFAPRAGNDRPPVRLVVVGNRPVTLAVPFKLRDVPLP
jgi:hypothetical protein